MSDETSVLSVKDYGHVRLKLNALMDEREINRYTLSRRVDTRFEVIDKWYNGKVDRIDLDVLARICFVLNCSVSDVLEYCPVDGEAAEPEIL